MDHTAGRSVNSSPEEELRLSPGGREAAAAPARGAPRPLFIAVTALAMALAGLCVWLALQCLALGGQARYAAQLADRLAGADARLDQANAGLTAAREALALREEELARAQGDLDAAQELIARLEEFSFAAPDGTPPEYAALYPDLYAPAWAGEPVAGGRVCCLTFDDGPSANTDRVLEILDRYGVKATFFVVGKTGPADQERMRKIVAAGHTLAMHSWSHNYRTLYASVDAFLAEFDQLYRWIYEVTGTRPSVYRFPGGSLNGYDRGVYQEIIAEMTRRGFVYFDWNASAQDATVKPLPAAAVAANCLKGVGKDLAVVLCHDSAARGTTVDALPAVIEGYQAAGYTFSALHPGVRPITFGYPQIR